jgi:hypothetical protein
MLAHIGAPRPGAPGLLVPMRSRKSSDTSWMNPYYYNLGGLPG